MKKIVCFYHSRDLDGWTSAAIVKEKFPDVILIGWDYGDPVPYVTLDTEYILVDVSFPENWMKEYIKYPTIWIDHHKSAIEDSKLNYYDDLDGKRDSNYAACELTWEYFFPDKPMPEMVRLLGRYDCFGHKGTDEEERVLMFQYAARAMASNPEEAAQFLEDRDSFYINQIVEDGKKIYRYLCVQARQAYNNRFRGYFDGLPFIIIPTERINPVNFGIDYHKDGYVGAACFWYKDHKWHWSLYNDDGSVDVSELCKRRGGGGHPGAAGFVSEDFKQWKDE